MVRKGLQTEEAAFAKAHRFRNAWGICRRDDDFMGLKPVSQPTSGNEPLLSAWDCAKHWGYSSGHA